MRINPNFTKVANFSNLTNSEYYEFTNGVDLECAKVTNAEYYEFYEWSKKTLLIPNPRDSQHS